MEKRRQKALEISGHKELHDTEFLVLLDHSHIFWTGYCRSIQPEITDRHRQKGSKKSLFLWSKDKGKGGLKTKGNIFFNIHLLQPNTSGMDREGPVPLVLVLPAEVG